MEQSGLLNAILPLPKLPQNDISNIFIFWPDFHHQQSETAAAHPRRKRRGIRGAAA